MKNSERLCECSGNYHIPISGKGINAKRRLWLVSLFMLAILPGLYSQTVDYAVHANIIYRFTKYINWPETKKSGDFVIGIVGESPLVDALNTFIANKTVGSQKIVIQRLSHSEAAYNCHILFIGEEESDNFKKIVARTAGNSTLILSESDGLALRGGCINFIVVSDHLKLEINKNNIEQRHLSIASELLQLGRVVK
jgi:hypothetical protein